MYDKSQANCRKAAPVRLYEYETGKFIMNIPRRNLNAAEIEARLRILEPNARYWWYLQRMDAARFGERSRLALWKTETEVDR